MIPGCTSGYACWPRCSSAWWRSSRRCRHDSWGAAAVQTQIETCFLMYQYKMWWLKLPHFCFKYRSLLQPNYRISLLSVKNIWKKKACIYNFAATNTESTEPKCLLECVCVCARINKHIQYILWINKCLEEELDKARGKALLFGFSLNMLCLSSQVVCVHAIKNR